MTPFKQFEYTVFGLRKAGETRCVEIREGCTGRTEALEHAQRLSGDQGITDIVIVQAVSVPRTGARNALAAVLKGQMWFCEDAIRAQFGAFETRRMDDGQWPPVAEVETTVEPEALTEQVAVPVTRDGTRWYGMEQHPHALHRTMHAEPSRSAGGISQCEPETMLQS